MHGGPGAAAAFTLVAVLAAGCADFGPTSALVEFAVTGATLVEEDCFFGPRDAASDPSWCHRVQVSVRNVDAERDASTDRLDWEAVGSDGGVYSMPYVEGPTAVAPGGTAALTLKFDAGGDVRLTKLRYQPTFSDTPVVAAVPAYGPA